MSDMKIVAVWNNALKVRKGKFAAQTGHAFVGAFLKGATIYDITTNTSSGYPSSIAFAFPADGYAAQWIHDAFTKIVVRVDSDEELLKEYQKIVDYNETASIQLPCVLITDAGRTEFNGVPTRTCFGVGPGPVELIDRFTGHLKLM